MSAITSIAGHLSSQNLSSVVVPNSESLPIKQSGKISFKSVLQNLGHAEGTKKIDFLGQDLTHELMQAQQAMIQGKHLPIEQILGLQIKVHQLGLRVELVSKLSESLMTSVRKLQSQQ